MHTPEDAITSYSPSSWPIHRIGTHPFHDFSLTMTQLFFWSSIYLRQIVSFKCFFQPFPGIICLEAARRFPLLQKQNTRQVKRNLRATQKWYPKDCTQFRSSSLGRGL